jgi:hypothetical protein
MKIYTQLVQTAQTHLALGDVAAAQKVFSIGLRSAASTRAENYLRETECRLLGDHEEKHHLSVLIAAALHVSNTTCNDKYASQDSVYGKLSEALNLIAPAMAKDYVETGNVGSDALGHCNP